MKIKGRLIATLAALGLLIAMLPIGPAFAAVGKVGITGGGEDGKFFSDRASDEKRYNVVELSVTDQDLSPVRVGKARYVYLQTAGIPVALTGFNLTNSPEDSRPTSLAGEKNKIEELDGNVDDLTTADNIEGAVIFDIGDDTADTPAGATDDRWYIVLDEKVRDRGTDGVVDASDITVSIDGTTRNTGFTFTEAMTPAARGGTVTYPTDERATIATYLLAFDYLTFTAVPEPGVKNVVVTYMYSEYDQTAPVNTPISLSGTRITYAEAGANATAAPAFTSNNLTLAKQIDSVGAGLVKPTTDLAANTDNFRIVEILFEYNVKEPAINVATVTSNTSIASGQSITVDGVESSASSSKFEAKIAVFENSDFAKINGQALNDANDTDDPKNGVQVRELDKNEGLGAELFDRVKASAMDVLGKTEAQVDETDASELVELLLPVADGDTLTVVYQDASPSATINKSAEIDLAAPVVTLITPTQKLYTSESLLTMSAEVVDTGSGVDQNNIQLVAVGNSPLQPSTTTLKSPIANGYRVSNVPSTVITEGEKMWAIQVVDNVGNIPLKKTATQKAALGAVGKGEVESTNPFIFYVDTSGPTLTSAKTGVYLKNPGVTTGEEAGRESQLTNNRNWVRVSFDPGAGTAPLDAATVSTSDFLVDGAEPTDIRINARGYINTDQGGAATKGSAVYLTVGQLDTDARPKVVLVGEIKDRAGNIRTEGTVNSAIDGLAPIVTATPSVDIAEKSVMVTVTSSERLGLNPTVQLTTEKPKYVTPEVEEGEDPKEAELVLEAPSVLTVELQTGTFTTWTGTETNPAGAAEKWYVVVSASDQSGNAAVIGDAKSSNGGASPSEDDVVSFQLDDSEPSVKFLSSTDPVIALDDSKNKPEEGAVWIVAQFDEDEHDGDSYKKVNVTEMTLEVTDGDEITTDIAMLFGGDAEIDCDDHDNSDLTDRCVNITLAVNLAPNAYTYTITGVDSVGNDVTKSVEFTVAEAKPFELELKPGVNLVSIPAMPRDDGGMLDVMLADAPVSTVLTYDGMAAASGGNPWLTSIKDPETGVFSGDITMIEPGKAYFITSAASYTVNVKLEAAGGLPPTISVRQGYNAIGFVSISGAEKADIELYLNSIGWSVAYSYDPTPGKGWKAIRKGESTEDNMEFVEAGKGYLVFASYDSTLTP